MKSIMVCGVMLVMFYAVVLKVCRNSLAWWKCFTGGLICCIIYFFILWWYARFCGSWISMLPNVVLVAGLFVYCLMKIKYGHKKQEECGAEKMNREDERYE